MPYMNVFFHLPKHELIYLKKCDAFRDTLNRYPSIQLDHDCTYIDIGFRSGFVLGGFGD